MDASHVPQCGCREEGDAPKRLRYGGLAVLVCVCARACVHVFLFCCHIILCRCASFAPVSVRVYFALMSKTSVVLLSFFVKIYLLTSACPQTEKNERRTCPSGIPSVSFLILTLFIAHVTLLKVCNTEDEVKLPYFRYVTSYVMGGDVQQDVDIDAMVSALN